MHIALIREDEEGRHTSGHRFVLQRLGRRARSPLGVHDRVRMVSV